ncbi:MAG: hypothetical protein GYA87_00760, partial [Christensenellaceae bacterium]|nr:hypothetical protein [Christensenellaceae bacterium]
MKKILSLFLVAFLLLGVLPTNVFADNINILESKAVLSVKAVPNHTSLRTNQRLVVTTTASGGTAPYMYANYVIKDGKYIYKGWYGTNREFSYVPKTPGTYQITCFVRDKIGGVKYVNTVPIKVSSWSTTAPIKISTATNSAQLYSGEKVTVKVVASGGAGGYSYAYYLRRNGKVVHKEWYSNKNTFTYGLVTPGSYDILCFVKDRQGKIASNSIRKITVVHSPKYRALVIGQHEYWDHYLSGTDVDARNMYNKFLNNPPYGKMEKLQGWLDV